MWVSQLRNKQTHTDFTATILSFLNLKSIMLSQSPARVPISHCTQKRGIRNKPLSLLLATDEGMKPKHWAWPIINAA